MPEDRWRALFAAADGIDDQAEHITWGGGPEESADGEPRVIQMPYAIYSDDAERLIAALGGVGAVVPFNWPDWDGADRYRGPTALDDAPVADAVRMATAIIRAERFSDGTIAVTLADGTLGAVVRRLRRWYEHERNPKE